MWDANVGTTTRVLDAATAAGTTRIVYVSTVNVFGDAPAGRFVGQPKLAEIVSASAGVSNPASSERAEAELGFHARALEDGLHDVLGG